MNKSETHSPREFQVIKVQSSRGWDGPFYRISECQDILVNESFTSKALFINTVEAEGCWIATLAGHGYFKNGQQRELLHPGKILSIRKPSQGALIADPKGLPWNFLYISVIGAQSLTLFDFIIQKYGLLQSIPPQAQALQKGLQLIDTARQKSERPPHEWSALIFDWMNTWWNEVQENCPPISSALRDPISFNNPETYSPGSIKSLAEQIGYSRAYLTRKLKEQWGETPGKVLRRARLEEGARLLRTSNMKVGDIAEKIGFSTSTSFVRAFNRMYGQSPLTYRHSNR